MIKIDFTTKPEPTIPEYVFDEYGNKCLYDEMGKLHSYNDLPAVIMQNGSKHWYKHGETHRDNDMPAVVSFDGYNQYWIDGKFVKDEIL